MKHSWLMAAIVLLSGSVYAHQEKRLPAKVSLKAEFNRMGMPVATQGKRDTCSLFVITAITEFESFKANPRAGKRLSEEFLTWAANEGPGRSGDQAMFYEAVHGLNTFGTCAADLMPYEQASDAKRKPSPEALADAKGLSQRWKAHWIKRWDLSRGLNESELIAVKTALANGHPVACGLRWPRVLQGALLLEVPRPGDVFDGHSIVFTGYEDDAARKGDGVLHFRNSMGPNWGEQGYGSMSYAYARAYTNDALWLQPGAANSEIPVERFEAETMTPLAKHQCETTRQKMDSWGKGMWSGGEQLFCKADAGASVEFGFSVRKAGRYRLRVLATAAPDFGVLRVSFNGKVLTPDFDLYAGRVCPAGSLEIGERELTASKHSLRFAIVGKNAASKNYCFGIDAIDLLAPESKHE